MKSNGDTGRVLALLVVASIILIFTVFNYRAFQLSIDINSLIGYVLMLIVTYAIYANWEDFKGFLSGPKNLIGIDEDMKEDIAYALVAGVAFIGLNKMSAGFSIGIPLYSNALSDIVLLVVVGAPLLEELFFRGALYQFFKGLFGNDKTAIIGSLILNIIMFSGFHFLFYGMDIQAGYLGTTVMSIIGVVMVEQRESIVPSIVFHSLVNTYILLTTIIKI